MDTQLASSITREIDDITRISLIHIRDYFDRPTTKDTDEAKVDKAIKIAAIGARRLAAETNRMAVRVKVAQLMRLSGEALEPLWFELTGTNARAYARKPAPPIVEVKAHVGRPVGGPRKKLEPGTRKSNGRHSRL
jgi:hypothetical protein